MSSSTRRACGGEVVFELGAEIEEMALHAARVEVGRLEKTDRQERPGPRHRHRQGSAGKTGYHGSGFVGFFVTRDEGH